MNNVTMYILTHKKFDYDAIEEKEMYKPLLCGSIDLNDDYGYICDDAGKKNISNLNKYYAELTGEYWPWKNDDSDIIGFCHYRRYFVKNIWLNKLAKKDILEILANCDIILPQKTYLHKTNIEQIESSHLKFNFPAKKDDYVLLRKIIAKESPEYLESFDEVLNEKEVYTNNMFICRKEIANDYFNWLFSILKIFEAQTDFSQYDEGNTRVLGYLSELLLNIYVKKHKLVVNERYLLLSELRIPILSIFGKKSPYLQKFFNFLLNK